MLSNLEALSKLSGQRRRWRPALAGLAIAASIAASRPLVQHSAGDASAGPANRAVWELQLKGGAPQGCTIQFARVTKDDKGRAAVQADSRGDRIEWHSCIAIPSGLLKAGQPYTITVDYEVVDRSGEGSYFYVFARSRRLGNGADRWERWHGEAGDHGVAKLRFSPVSDDYAVIAGIHNQGAIRIQDMKIVHGNGWATVPLENTSGKGAAPAPAGAQPFTVDAPKATGGPVLNLADFGAVADGSAPPSPGTDRNSAALKAAIAKCREVKASKLIVPKGVYRISSGQTISFADLSDFVFDGGGSTFLFHQIKGGHGIGIRNCNRAVFCNFNLDWDWKIEPLASVGRITTVAPDSSFFEMRFDAAPPLDPKRWVTMNPLDEKLRAPGTGYEIGGFTPKKIDKLDANTVRVWPSRPVTPVKGRLYLLRHYTYEKHGIVMTSNTHLLLRDINIFSFPGIGFLVGGNQHHFELQRCRITYPDNQRRPITTTADGFHVAQSQGFIMLEDCDFGYMGDDCVNIHDNIHAGARRADAHTLATKGLVLWSCPFNPGDRVEIRKGDFSPMGLVRTLTAVRSDPKTKETLLVFKEELPASIPTDAILYNLRYGSHNYIIRNCYFHENRARGILCNTADGLIEGNRFFHDQFQAMIVLADVDTSWSEGFGGRDIIIRNNTFESINPAGVGDGAVVSVTAAVYGSASHYPLIEHLLLENNVFKEMTGFALDARSFKTLVFSNNHLTDVQAAPIALTGRGSIRAEYGTGLWVEENDWTTGHGIASPDIEDDPDTTTGVVSKGNRLKS